MIPRSLAGMALGLALLGAVATVGSSTAAPSVLPATLVATASGPGTPWTWGGNAFGQLGDGTFTSRTTPAAIPSQLLSGLVVDMHGGREHVAALRSDGTVWTWGSNQQGQLGIGPSGNRSTPAQVTLPSDAVAVETGHNFSMALLDDGTVWTWGMNGDGQLGDGTTTRRNRPVRVVGIGGVNPRAVAIAGGRNMAYAIREDGSVVGWGRNDQGQVGDGTLTRRLTPVRVGSLTEVVGIAGGRDHGLALRDDGTVWAWGSNDYGQLGDGTRTDRHSPVQVMSGGAEVIAGAHHSYALRTDGQVSAWGRNYRANLGDGTTTLRTRPVLVQNVVDAVSIGSGRDFGQAVRSDGRLWTWGDNASGQLGDGTLTRRPRAILVPGVSGAVKAAGGGAAYAVVLVGSP